MLVSTIHHHESAIAMHMSPPSWPFPPPPTPSHSSRLSQSTRLSFLHQRANSHLLSILHMVRCMFPCCSLHSSHPLLPPLCPEVCSLCLCLHCCPAKRFISIIFLDSIYMCQYTVFVFLFLAHFTPYDRL